MGLPPRVALGFAAAVLCLAATVVVTMRLEAVRDEQARLVHQATETLLALEALDGALRITAAAVEVHLEAGAPLEQPLTRQALGRFEPSLERAGRLLSAEPAQRARLERLQPLVLEVARLAQASLAAAHEGDLDGAHALATDLGRSSLPAVEASLRELVRAETALLEERQGSWRRTAIAGAVVFAAATLALLGLLLLAARRVRAELQLSDRLSAERAEVLALQQQLMAVVSHDLCNPLAVMKSAAGLIARDRSASDGHREDARRVVSNARRMERLIRDLLDFSRLRSGHLLPLRLEEADLVELVRLAVSDLGRDAEGLVTVEGLGDVAGRWDRDRLDQVTVNLVTNALKYGPARRPVRVLVDGRGDEVRLSVHDEGGGLPPVLHEAVFEPFRRGVAGDAQERRSVGLGLYIVRRIAEAHGGSAAVDSAPGRGTTFTVTLPRRPGGGAAPAAAGG